MIRQIFIALVFAAPLVLAACKTTDVAARTSNPGSHPLPWVENRLLPGRTVVLWDGGGHYPADWKNWFVTRAAYHTRAGNALSCEGEKLRYSEVRLDGSYWTTMAYHELGTAAAHTLGGDLWPVFFDTATGGFHVERWNSQAGWWEYRAAGWVQEGWPRLMADACPELTQEILADGGWINEKQTHPTIWKMLEQDPTAPLVLDDPLIPTTRHGVAATRYGDRWHWCFTAPNRPVLPAHCFPEGEEAASGDDGAALLLPESPVEAHAYRKRLALADTLKAANGNILEDRLGRTYVLALGETDEFWAVDRAGRLTDVGYLTWNDATQTLELDWEIRGDVADYHYRPGDPLPVIDTGRRHPAFAIADWLVADAGDVVLPYQGREARFRFGADGALTVRGTTRDFGGSWTVSRGRLVLEIDGIAERAGYPWDLLAGHLRATTGYAG